MSLLSRSGMLRSTVALQRRGLFSATRPVFNEGERPPAVTPISTSASPTKDDIGSRTYTSGHRGVIVHLSRFGSRCLRPRLCDSPATCTDILEMLTTHDELNYMTMMFEQ